MNPRIKRIKNPTFTQAEMDALDPVLLRGEIVCLRDVPDYKVSNWKIGDGVSKWSELPFLNASKYPYTDLVTNPLGDLVNGSSQYQRDLSAIVKDIISPYQAPVVSNVRNNAAGSAQATAQKEIGQSIGSAVQVTFSVSNQSNLITNPITIDTSGVFVESNPYPNGAISIAPVSVIAPTSPTIYTIRVKATHLTGDSAWANTYIRFDMRPIWGASTLADLTTNQHALDLIANGGGSAVKQNFKDTYEISVGGYQYVLIPSVLITGTIVWTEVSDPNAPASVAMVNLGTLSVNNGVGTYNYTKFRSPFNNLSGSKFKAS